VHSFNIKSPFSFAKRYGVKLVHRTPPVIRPQVGELSDNMSVYLYRKEEKVTNHSSLMRGIIWNMRGF
jgi:hypothetical protein